MDPLFQVAQDHLFDTIEKVYGQPCSWTPSAGGDTMTAIVLYNGPTHERMVKVTNGRGLSHVGYNNGNVVERYIEYRDGQFDGLFESMYEGGNEELIITLKDNSLYRLRAVANTSALYDGQTYRVPVVADLYQIVFSNLNMVP